MYSEKFLKTHKTVSESISYNVADFFYSKSTLREFGHSRMLEEHLGTRGNRALKALGRSGTWALGHLKSTWELRHSKDFDTRGTLFSRLWCNLFNRNLSWKVPNALRKSINIPKTSFDHFQYCMIHRVIIFLFLISISKFSARKIAFNALN